MTKTGRTRGVIYRYVRDRISSLNRTFTHLDFPDVASDQSRNTISGMIKSGEIKVVRKVPKKLPGLGTRTIRICVAVKVRPPELTGKHKTTMTKLGYE